MSRVFEDLQPKKGLSIKLKSLKIIKSGKPTLHDVQLYGSDRKVSLLQYHVNAQQFTAKALLRQNLHLVEKMRQELSLLTWEKNSTEILLKIVPFDSKCFSYDFHVIYHFRLLSSV